MSKDYPDREVWLAKRNAPKRPVRFIHVSGIGRRLNMPGKTYNVGRNKAKRAKVWG